MTTVRQVYEAMQAIAPLELAEHWDNPGLLVDCGGQMHRVLAALDITPEVVAEAAAKQCEMIVSHHPVIFDPLKKIGPQDVPFQLVQAGISAICMHTNLDAAEGGVNEVLAGIFDMKNMETFAECLFGSTGEWPEGKGYADWQKAKLPRMRLGVPDGSPLAAEIDAILKEVTEG